MFIQIKQNDLKFVHTFVYIVSSLFRNVINLYLINLLNFESLIIVTSKSKAFTTDRSVLGPSDPVRYGGTL